MSDETCPHCVTQERGRLREQGRAEVRAYAARWKALARSLRGHEERAVARLSGKDARLAEAAVAIHDLRTRLSAVEAERDRLRAQLKEERAMARNVYETAEYEGVWKDCVVTTRDNVKDLGDAYGLREIADDVMVSFIQKVDAMYPSLAPTSDAQSGVEPTDTTTDAWKEWLEKSTGGYWKNVKCVECELGRECAVHPDAPPPAPPGLPAKETP